MALENRPEMKQARLALKNAEIDTNFTKNQTLPLLDLNAGYTQTVRGRAKIKIRPGSQPR